MKEKIPDGFPAERVSEEMMQVAPHVAIRLVNFYPAGEATGLPLVMVTGLATRMESFRGVLHDLSLYQRIYYLETREKSSSEISGKAGFGMDEHAGDIVKAISLLGLKAGKYVLMGYSYGATAIAHAYTMLAEKPAAMLLMEPTPVFRYPVWAKLLISISVPVYPVIKAFAKWYLRRFHINTKEDAEMALISSRALDNADPQKLRDSILAVWGYELWSRLPLIDCPTLVVATSKDGLHLHADIIHMTTSIKDCTYVDMENNKRSHSAEMAAVIRNYLENNGL